MNFTKYATVEQQKHQFNVLSIYTSLSDENVGQEEMPASVQCSSSFGTP
jgi:hypothetical protein